MSEATFYQKLLDEYSFGRLFTPGNRICFETADKKILYVALDPKQKPPEHGLFQEWISVEDRLPPQAKCEQYLVCVRSGGGVYGNYEYNIDFAWWGMIYDLNNRECGCGWETVLNDWDGDVQITHWMPMPDPPEDLGNACK